MLIGDYSLLGLGRNFTPTSAFFYTAILLIVPLVLALHLNSYMHSKKASDVYHASSSVNGTPSANTAPLESRYSEASADLPRTIRLSRLPTGWTR